MPWQHFPLTSETSLEDIESKKEKDLSQDIFQLLRKVWW